MSVEYSDPRYSSPPKTAPRVEASSRGDAVRTFIYNPVVRSIVTQLLLFGLLIWAGYALVTNTAENLARQKIASGFGFLSNESGFGIIQSLIPYSEASTHLDVFVVGLLNTILVSVVGIVIATILGFLVGVGRLSSNWVISKIALAYVEVMRNIPLLLHILIWYIAVLRALPQPRETPITLVPGSAFLNIKGIFAPDIIAQDGFNWVWAALAIGIGLTIVSSMAISAYRNATGVQLPGFWIGLGLIIGLPVMAFFALGSPAILEFPEFRDTGPILRRGFDQDKGIVIIPEFLALLLALSTYTAAYIAEIVRGGIQAVSKGQSEAAFALGVRPGLTLNLVVIPQALRVIIPPMTNQYLNLTKNSSLATAIAYPDLVSVFTGTSLNQTGQAIEVILMTMAVYLTLSIVISIIMNIYNARIALVER